MPAPAASSTSSGGLGIRYNNIERRFGPLLALRGISLDIRSGEFVALLGANGAGKTTLLRVTAQLMRPSRGTVDFTSAESASARSGSAGESKLPQDEMKRSLGLVGHSLLLYDDLTAQENLTLFAKLYGLTNITARVSAALESCGLAARATSLVRTFSRGMRQRLAIARALLHGPRVLLLDEPAAGLDRQGLAWFGATLEKLRGDGCTVLMSTHARNESLDLATRAIALAGGRVEHDSGLGGDPRPLLAALRAEA